MVEPAVALRECGSERFAGGVIGQVELVGDKSSRVRPPPEVTAALAADPKVIARSPLELGGGG